MDYLKIIEERKKLGLSQEELAEKIGVSQKSISKYECGTRRPTYETLTAMAKLFNVSTDYLLGTSDLLPLEEPRYTSQDEYDLIILYRTFQEHGVSDDIRNTLNDFFPGIFPSIPADEKKLLDSFRQLSDDNKDIIIGETKKCLKEQRYESVAADQSHRDNNSKKSYPSSGTEGIA